MTKETRLKIAKFQYAKGNLDHPHVKEFLDQLQPTEKPKKRSIYARRSH